MKKTLFMLALGLTIVTSMVAGTMAIYTHTDKILANETDELNGYAKKFFVGAKTTVGLEEIKLAPGETQEWDFEVTNMDKNKVISEVDTDLVISVDLGTVNNWDDFDVVLKKDGTVIGNKNKESNAIVFTVDNALAAGIEIHDGYTLEFTWLDGASGKLNDQQDTELVMNEDGVNIVLPHVTGISVTVTGNQSK